LFSSYALPSVVYILSLHDALPICGVLGCSISGQRCSAGNYLLYADAWFHSGHAEPARFRPGFNWRPEVNLERSWGIWVPTNARRSEEHTSELQSRFDLVCRLLLEK